MQGPNAWDAKKCCMFLFSVTLQNCSEQNGVSVEEQLEAFNHKWKQLKHQEMLMFDKGRQRFTAAGTLLRHTDLH